MGNNTSIQDDLVFGLDIGTRSIVGVVGYLEHGTFHIKAMAEKKHETRAMLDGQIHDIYKVGDTIRNVKNMLEHQLDRKLSDVCIAAAGRVLKTVNSYAEVEFEEEIRIDQEQIYSLNLYAVEKAYSKVNKANGKAKFYCVGNTPVRYSLNGYDIGNLEGHKANKIGVELIATFLPYEVVDGLYEAVEYAGLNVANLTLEPIAAMNIAIPEKFRLLNIGLIDVGAGTSDICLTKDGSVIAYGMIPVAGDEITEIIAKNYLVDFNTAEQIKLAASNEDNKTVTFEDVMGLPQEIPVEDILKVTDDTVENMAKQAADKIIELNGGKPVNAVFVVGGGGKVPGYTDKVAEHLGIISQRVAVRGKEVLANVDFMDQKFEKDSLYVTPIGICTNYYTQKNSFIFVSVNGERIKIYDNNHLTIVDAVMQIGFPNEKLFPQRGEALEFKVNGKVRLIRGEPGEGSVVTLNRKAANLNEPIEQNDVIEIKESTVGKAASITIGELDEFKSTIHFNVNGKNVVCPKFAYVNGELKSEFYEIKQNDSIKMEDYYTVEQLFEFMDLDISCLDVYVNNELADLDTKVYENFNVKTIQIGKELVLSGNDDKYTYVQEESEFQSIKDTEKPSGIQKFTLNSENASDERTGEFNAKKNLCEITITVNGQPVHLTGKSDYIFVDLFQFYDFDLSTPKGNIVLKLNGENGEYTAPLNNGDVVEIYWEE